MAKFHVIFSSGLCSMAMLVIMTKAFSELVKQVVYNDQKMKRFVL